MGPRVHVVLISPREAETEDVIVEEVTRSHTHTHTTSFFQDMAIFSFIPFLYQSVSIGATNTRQQDIWHIKAAIY